MKSNKIAWYEFVTNDEERVKDLIPTSALLVAVINFKFDDDGKPKFVNGDWLDDAYYPDAILWLDHELMPRCTHGQYYLPLAERTIFSNTVQQFVDDAWLDHERWEEGSEIIVHRAQRLFKEMIRETFDHMIDASPESA